MSVARRLPLPSVAIPNTVALGTVQAIASALLFGALGPALKLAGAGAGALATAALLQLGSGAAMASVAAIRGRAEGGAAESPLRRADWPWLAIVVASGGIVAPLLYVVGLSVVPASTTAVLLNLSGAFAVLVAWLVAKEQVGRRVWAGLACLLAGGVLVTGAGPSATGRWGALAIVGACVFWSVDTVSVRRIAGRDPFRIGAIKGLVSGAVTGTVAIAIGVPGPRPATMVVILLLGALLSGSSLVLFLLSVRHLGSARTAGLGSVSPGAGLAFGWLLLGEVPTPAVLSGLGLMLTGLLLQCGERHDHEHAHEAIEHEHRHVHDEHHRHDHAPGEHARGPHAHRHRHEELVHAHAHAPDLHHLHSHEGM